MKKATEAMNFPFLTISRKSISKPIINNKKSIPKLARNSKFDDSAIGREGLKKLKKTPKIRAEKIQGILILSRKRPNKKVTK